MPKASILTRAISSFSEDKLWLLKDRTAKTTEPGLPVSELAAIENGRKQPEEPAALSLLPLGSYST
jgi:hypothetical protein